MNIIVLAGGLSPERNVSLSSGSLIAAALRRKGHKVLLADVYEGVKIMTPDPLLMFTEEMGETFSVSEGVPDLDEIRKRNNNRRELVGDNILKLCRLADIVYIALHGDMGENGQLQAMLDIFNIKYTGSGYGGSMLAMNKDIAKKILSAAGVDTPRGICCMAEDFDEERVLSEVGLPCVLKPASGGSSVGISIVNTREELRNAFDAARLYENEIIIEQKIEGREFTCGMLEGRVLPPVEIIPKQGFYDYKNKYQAGSTIEICPAELTEEQLDNISKATDRAFAALRLSGYARFDYILDSEGRFWCLEANTLPGMTPTSLLPQEAKAVGIEYDELCDIIARSALKK